jgi:hypothetical protein
MGIAALRHWRHSPLGRNARAESGARVYICPNRRPEGAHLSRWSAENMTKSVATDIPNPISAQAHNRRSDLDEYKAPLSSGWLSALSFAIQLRRVQRTHGNPHSPFSTPSLQAHRFSTPKIEATGFATDMCAVDWPTRDSAAVWRPYTARGWSHCGRPLSLLHRRPKQCLHSCTILSL